MFLSLFSNAITHTIGRAGDNVENVYQFELTKNVSATITGGRLNIKISYQYMISDFGTSTLFDGKIYIYIYIILYIYILLQIVHKTLTLCATGLTG